VAASGERVRAFWCRVPSRPNFGDALTPWLIEKLTGRRPRFVAADDPRPKYVVTGSVMALAGPGSVVWGAGIMSRTDTIARQVTLLAVRGPLTRARALAAGVPCPEVYGDPALLLPRFYRPPARRRAGIGVVLHFSDRPRIEARWRPSAELRLIDIQDPVESVVDQIAACELIASSSLHGIIASHAYGVPAVWLKFRDLPSGDDSKFHDYQLAVGADSRPPARMVDDTVDPARFGAPLPPPVTFDTGPLWRACPFRGEA
jgi:pyruvyltransferase